MIIKPTKHVNNQYRNQALAVARPVQSMSNFRHHPLLTPLRGSHSPNSKTTKIKNFTIHSFKLRFFTVLRGVFTQPKSRISKKCLKDSFRAISRLSEKSKIISIRATMTELWQIQNSLLNTRFPTL